LHFRSVLYVDDDPDICSVVLATLRMAPDLVVETAESGERAIELAFEMRPDLILMDVMMPRLDGPSTLKCMQKSVLLANTPVIFMTAKVLPEEISQFLKLGAIGVVVKPFDPLGLYADLLYLWNHKNAEHKTSHTDFAQTQVQAQVESLTSGFLERARTDTLRLSTLMQRAKDGDPTVFKEMEHIAHSIHGAGAMFGFPTLSTSGETIARIAAGLASKRGQSAGDAASLLQRLLECSERLAHEVASASQTGPEKAAMFQGPLRPR
jgi:two-component system, OmpR family, response regulator